MDFGPALREASSAARGVPSSARLRQKLPDGRLLPMTGIEYRNSIGKPLENDGLMGFYGILWDFMGFYGILWDLPSGYD